jgi:hypothetical protein
MVVRRHPKRSNMEEGNDLGGGMARPIAQSTLKFLDLRPLIRRSVTFFDTAAIGQSARLLDASARKPTYLSAVATVPRHHLGDEAGIRTDE